MNLDLQFKDLPALRIDAIQLAGVIQTMRAITARNIAKATPGKEPGPLKDRKEKMKRRLMERDQSVTFEQATDEVGRERILLSLYLEYSARPDADWLDKFDKNIASSVLGLDGREWHVGRRRQATQLFFTHFDQLPSSGLTQLCELLVDAYDSMESEENGQVAHWQHHRIAVFSPTGHQDVANLAEPNETLLLLMERYAIPSEGRFAERLRQVFLLNAVRNGPLGTEIAVLAEIEALKTERASVSQLMGAAALQIMVQRVAREGGRKWSEEWSHWITRLGCDPRHGRATAEGTKWWGWATDDELRLAQQGVTGLTLKFFIRYLDGTVNTAQWENRSKFLIALFDAGKIDTARLVLNWATYDRLDQKYRDIFSVAHLSQTSDQTSMICLKCVDDIFIIEGTHNFGLRMFHRTFPIPHFWERPKRSYQDRELRISPAACPLFLPHDQSGYWVGRFFRHLRTSFHVEWGDVRI